MNDDTLVNDGCPAVAAPESGDQCANTTDDDGDGFVNDGCPQAGAFSEGQFRIGTGSLDPCGNNGWPLELVTSSFSANKFDIQDLGSFVAPTRRMGTIPGQAAFSSRWDVAPGDSGLTSSGWINIVDLGATIGGPTGFPPMLGGAMAMGGPVCPFPPLAQAGQTGQNGTTGRTGRAGTRGQASATGRDCGKVVGFGELQGQFFLFTLR